MNPELPLRDIHNVTVHWWPLAPGWWVLAAIALLLLIYGAFRLYRYQQNRRRRKALLDEAEGLWARLQSNQDLSAYIRSSSELLRRVIVHVAGRRDLAGTAGAGWTDAVLEYASTSAGQDSALASAAQAVSVQTYQEKPDFSEPEKLRNLLNACIETAWRQSSA